MQHRCLEPGEEFKRSGTWKSIFKMGSHFWSTEEVCAWRPRLSAITEGERKARYNAEICAVEAREWMYDEKGNPVDAEEVSTMAASTYIYDTGAGVHTKNIKEGKIQRGPSKWLGTAGGVVTCDSHIVEEVPGCGELDHFAIDGPNALSASKLHDEQDIGFTWCRRDDPMAYFPGWHGGHFTQGQGWDTNMGPLAMEIGRRGKGKTND